MTTPQPYSEPRPRSTGQIVTLVVLLGVNALICLVGPFAAASLAFYGTVSCPDCISSELPIYVLGAVVVGSVIILLVTLAVSIVQYVRKGGGLRAAGWGLAAQIGLFIIGLGLIATGVS